MEREPLALVLSGAAALGAYQVGVLDHVINRVADELGGDVQFDVVSGTSAGAINAAGLASGADDPGAAVDRLAERWTALRLEEVLRPSAVELLSMIAEVGAAPARLQRVLRALGARGGLVDARPIERLCEEAVRPGQIAAHLAAGRLGAVAVAATQVATGRATVFHQGGAARAVHGATAMIAGELGTAHVLASAAVPLLFPAVAIDGELYCDGGLRQLVPLSPALHLGARRVVMVSAMALPSASSEGAAARRAAADSPLYLAGKALDALFTDGVDGDLDRLLQINRLLEAGRRRFGPAFTDELGAELEAMGAPAMRPVDVVHVRPSRDLGGLAAEYIADGGGGALHGAVSRGFRRLIDQDPTRAGGLLAYLLFDGGFAAELIALGRADARAHHAALVALCRPRPAT